ncbi:MAG: hypothetical protein V4850_32720 [Myxococcota bacterium]
MHWIFAITAAFLGLLIWMLAVPLKNGTVARNPLYGFRTPATLASEWFRVVALLLVVQGPLFYAVARAFVGLRQIQRDIGSRK